MPHVAHFDLKTHGGICAGQEWIYDNDEPIARLQDHLVEEPEQNLRYFKQILKPIELREIRLRPGSRPLVAGVQLYWKMGPIATTELLAINVRGRQSDRLEIEVVTSDPGKVATSRRFATISYDAATHSYVYDFAAQLEIHSPEFFDNARDFPTDRLRFEYCDPWYADLPAPVAPFPGMWQARHTRLLAEKVDGQVWQMPLNHMATSIASPQAFAPDGLLVLADDPGNNPAFQFVGATAARTAIGVCNWGYDIHFNAGYSRDELYAPIREQFRLVLCPDTQVADLQKRAAPVPTINYNGHTELPLYERKTSFAQGLVLNQASSLPTDPWPWLPAGPGTEWCKEHGRSDAFSLKIAKESDGPSEWYMNREGDGAWVQRWTQATGFRISAYIETRGVDGRGTCIAVRWALYNTPERFPYICSQKLIGDNDWTRVSVEIHGPPPPDVSTICIILRQDGCGTSFFDDLEVELLQGEH